MVVGAMVAMGLVPLPTNRAYWVFMPLPVPPLLTGKMPVTSEVKSTEVPKVEARVIWPKVEVVRVMPEPCMRLTIPQFVPWEPKSCPASVGAVEVPVPPLDTESWPVKPGIKVKVLAVVVEMLRVMLVSVLVATWIAGPVKAEMEVKAEVK
jgi:hypothetical protein